MYLYLCFVRYLYLYLWFNIIYLNLVGWGQREEQRPRGDLLWCRPRCASPCTFGWNSKYIYFKYCKYPCTSMYIRLKVKISKYIWVHPHVHSAESLGMYLHFINTHIYIQGVQIYTFCILPATDEGTPADGDCNPE